MPCATLHAMRLFMGSVTATTTCGDADEAGGHGASRRTAGPMPTSGVLMHAIFWTGLPIQPVVSALPLPSYSLGPCCHRWGTFTWPLTRRAEPSVSARCQLASLSTPCLWPGSSGGHGLSHSGAFGPTSAIRPIAAATGTLIQPGTMSPRSSTSCVMLPRRPLLSFDCRPRGARLAVFHWRDVGCGLAPLFSFGRPCGAEFDILGEPSFTAFCHLGQLVGIGCCGGRTPCCLRRSSSRCSSASGCGCTRRPDTVHSLVFWLSPFAALFIDARNSWNPLIYSSRHRAVRVLELI